jgi:predicted ester cyclase
MPTHSERLTAALDAWNAGDLDGYLALYDDTIRLHGYAPQPLDKVGVTGFYRGALASLTAPGERAPQLTVLHMAEGGDWVSCVFEMAGAQVGPFMGVPPSGRPYRIGGVTMLRFAPSGRVVERFSSADFLGLMVQIGALAMPG